MSHTITRNRFFQVNNIISAVIKYPAARDKLLPCNTTESWLLAGQHEGHSPRTLRKELVAGWRWAAPSGRWWNTLSSAHPWYSRSAHSEPEDETPQLRSVLFKILIPWKLTLKKKLHSFITCAHYYVPSGMFRMWELIFSFHNARVCILLFCFVGGKDSLLCDFGWSETHYVH